MFRAIIYDAEGRDRDIDPTHIDLAAIRDHQLIWTYGDPAGFAAAPLPAPIAAAARTMASANSTFERYDAYYQVSLPQSGHDAPIAFAAGEGWLATLCETMPAFVDAYVDEDKGETLKGALTPATLLAVLIEQHFAALHNQIGEIDSAVDKLDEDVLASRQRKYTLEMLAVLRRRAGRLRKTIAGQRAAIQALSRADFIAALDDDDAHRFERLHRGYERLEDDINRARETVIASFELYAAREAHDTNRLIRALTVVTVITGVIGSIAGVFSMNFHVGFEDTGARGFATVTGSMVALSIIVTLIALRRKWF